LLGLQARFGVDVWLLPLDVPVAQLVEGDSLAGDGADHVIALGQQPEGSREIVDTRGAAIS
jgi:hypothetical protein